ncbi:hypothetical protein [uncultured Mediterranean phage]|nr:hypothetical protein [uncultured Mediterranean phage]
MAKVPTTGATAQPDQGGLSGPPLTGDALSRDPLTIATPRPIPPDSGDAPTPDDLEQLEDDEFEALNEQNIEAAGRLNAMPEDDGTTLDFPPTNDTASFDHSFALVDPDEYDSVDGDAITRLNNINNFHSPGQASIREIEDEVRAASIQAGLPYRYTQEDRGVNYTIERRPGVGDFVTARNGVAEAAAFPVGGYLDEETGEILPMPAAQFRAEVNKIVTDPMHEYNLAVIGGPTTQEEIDAANTFFANLSTTIRDLPSALMRGGARTFIEAFAASPAARFVDSEKIQFARDFITHMSDEAEKHGVLQTGAETLTGFIVAFNPIVRALRLAGFGRSLSTIAAFGLVKAAATNPDDPNLANLIMEFTAFAEGIGDEETPVTDEAVFPIGSRASINAIAAFLATKPGSPEEDKAERFLREGLNRTRNFAVGFAEGVGIESVLGFFKAMKLLSPKEVSGFEKEVNELIGKLRKEAEAQERMVPKLSLIEPTVEKAGDLPPRRVMVASRTIEKPISPTVGQRDMRIRQISLGNSIKSGEVTTGNLPAGVDAEEVRSILGRQNPITTPTPGNIPIVEGSEANTFIVQSPKVPIVGTGGKKKNLVGPKDIGKFWDRHHIERYGRQGDPANPADFARALQQAEAEVRFQLNMIETGEAFYEEDIVLLKKITEEVFPEVMDHPIFNAAFDGNGLNANYLHELITLIATPMSFGVRPKPNMNAVYKIFDIFLEGGRIPSMNPETGKMWSSRPAGREGLEVIQSMIDQIGIRGTMKWLTEQHPVSELRAMKRSTNVFEDTQAMNVPGTETDMKMGAYILGKKGGPYFLNLNGYDVLTSDLWDARSFNRPFGRMTGPGAVAKSGLKDSPVEAERGLMIEFNQELANRVNKKQMATQAIRWYYEQKLFHSQGQANAQPTKLSDGATHFRDNVGRRSTRDGGGSVQRTEETPARGVGPGDGSLARDESGKARVKGLVAEGREPPPGQSKPTAAPEPLEPELSLGLPPLPPEAPPRNRRATDDLEVVEAASNTPPGIQLTPGLQAYMDDNRRILGQLLNKTDFQDVDLNIEARLKAQFRELEGQRSELPDKIGNMRLKPLVTIGNEPLTIPIIQGLGRVLVDRIFVPPVGVMPETTLGHIGIIAEHFRGGNDLDMQFNPALTSDQFLTNVPHEIGHVITFRVDEFRRQLLQETKSDQDLEIMTGIGIVPVEDAEVMVRDLNFKRFTAAYQAVFGYDGNVARSKAFDVLNELEQLSRTRREDSWLSIDKGTMLLERGEMPRGGQAEKTVTSGVVYMLSTSELTGDGMASMMERPDITRQVAPVWTAFVKKLINEDPLISRILYILGLSSIMLPGVPELLEEIDPKTLEEGGG